MLQQYSQQTFGNTPTYELLDEKGPDHDKCFESCVVIDKRRFGSAWAVTKKEAEQKAARKALVELGLIAEAEGDDS
jgi:ribonuclease-3